MPMNFLRQQELARRHTRLLVVLFVLCVAATVLTLDLLGAGISIWLARARAERAGLPPPPLAVPLEFHLWVIGVSLAVILGSTLYKLVQLSRRGGEKVAESAGGRRLARDAAQNPSERHLQNIVEEMAIASGTRPPDIWLLDREASINAFTAGYDSDRAVIAVTRGALSLSRDELQGVIAHEYSHILSGDTRLNMRLLTVVFGMLSISTIGRTLRASARGLVRLASRAQGEGEAGGLVKAVLVVAILPWLLGAIVSMIGATGVLFGRVVRAAVSRQREFLGDAAAVEYTRNPDGIGRALMRVAASPAASAVAHLRSEALSHFFFVSPGRSGLFNWLGSHPRPRARLRRIYGRR